MCSLCYTSEQIKVHTFAANVVVSLKPDSCNLTPIFPDTTLNKNAKKDPFSFGHHRDAASHLSHKIRDYSDAKLKIVHIFKAEVRLSDI